MPKRRDTERRLTKSFGHFLALPPLSCRRRPPAGGRLLISASFPERLSVWVISLRRQTRKGEGPPFPLYRVAGSKSEVLLRLVLLFPIVTELQNLNIPILRSPSRAFGGDGAL